MATASHSVEVKVPQKEVWDFVSNMEKWATLVPGYREHQIINDQQSTWTFSGNVGVLKKEVKVQIDITGWEEPNKISFNLTGLTDKFSGNGYFEDKAIDENKTEMTGHLEVKAGGLAGPVLNPIFSAVLPKATSILTNRVANKIQLVHA
ncbi:MULTISPECIES: CoxG family protein [unclassified Rummeliibacillus]|uniref:CoxG family protein n=1 Tax=unclassified Rummeliibacillus TaxID=2622809 RepID=UPI000E66EAE8|nr:MULTISPECIES: SRPBCC family protein [unclassified Rummeliibacillus]RIJ66905.1 SRPBCC family protein [Rummeliibacillus sp. POC4]RPJ95310.1 SRPBCC family protein [Rummeliibacillus sp. TYF005]